MYVQIICPPPLLLVLHFLYSLPPPPPILVLVQSILLPSAGEDRAGHVMCFMGHWQKNWQSCVWTQRREANMNYKYDGMQSRPALSLAVSSPCDSWDVSEGKKKLALDRSRSQHGAHSIPLASPASSTGPCPWQDYTSLLNAPLLRTLK